jgi:hypothetical protein
MTWNDDWLFVSIGESPLRAKAALGRLAEDGNNIYLTKWKLQKHNLILIFA